MEYPLAARLHIDNGTGRLCLTDAESDIPCTNMSVFAIARGLEGAQVFPQRASIVQASLRVGNGEVVITHGPGQLLPSGDYENLINSWHWSRRKR